MEKEKMLELIKDEFDSMEDNDKLKVVNDYNKAHNLPLIYENTIEGLVEFFNNDLEAYLLAKDADYTTYSDTEFYIKNWGGHLYSFDYIDVKDIDSFAEFIYANWEDYEGIFIDTAEELEKE